MRETFGVNRSAPDEFRVVSRPPLSVPPEFYLRPPSPGEPPRTSSLTRERAESLVLNKSDTGYSLEQEALDYQSDVQTAIDPVISDSLASTGEERFMDKVGASKADGDIRAKIYRETGIEPEESGALSPLQKMLGMKDESDVIDAKAEAERIRANKDEGKPINEGDVKTRDKKNQSTLEQLF